MTRVRREGRARGEDGLFLAWMGLTLLVMIAMAGLAVDVGQWYATAHRVQRAADSAAMGGVVFLPSDMPDATTTARAMSQRNGYSHGTNATVTPQQLAKPTQLRVTVSTEVNNFFGNLLGVAKQKITRDAVAEFEGPVPMGSPVNTLGNEPIGSGESAWTTGSGTPQMWLNVAGPGTTKISGDRHQAKVCDSGVSGCSGSSSTDYASDGYYFVVRVSAAAAADLTRKLAIEVFDPSFSQVGDNCTDANLSDAWQLDAVRYASGPGSAFCTGDHRVNGGSSDGPITSYIIRSPDVTPWIDSDNPVIQPTSVSTNSGGDFTGCGPKQYTPFNGNIKNRIQSNPAFAAYFRKWTRVCTVPITGPGDYLLQIRTNASSGNPLAYNSSIATRGHNRFALRAAMVSTGGLVYPAGLSVFANGRMPIYANATGADTQFHLARLMPGNDNRILHVVFFDTGDASQAGTIQVLPPVESGFSNFSGCVFQRDGSSPVTSNICQLTNVSSANYNGKAVDLDIPVPDGYSCNGGDAFGCWVRMKFQYPAGTSVQDTTTWAANMAGDPVRLIE